MSDKCKACGAEIVWARMGSGRKMPLDKRPDPEGNIAATLDRGTGEYIGWYADSSAGKALTYRSHFASCPDAELFRVKGEQW